MHEKSCEWLKRNRSSTSGVFSNSNISDESWIELGSAIGTGEQTIGIEEEMGKYILESQKQRRPSIGELASSHTISVLNH